MRDERARVDHLGIEHIQEAAHTFLAAGSECGDDSVIPQSSRERVTRDL